MTQEKATADARLYLEDLEAGRRFTSAETIVDRQEPIGFAERYDPQPFHLDDECARATIFKGLAASGWHPEPAR